MEPNDMRRLRALVIEYGVCGVLEGLSDFCSSRGDQVADQVAADDWKTTRTMVDSLIHKIPVD